MWDTEPAKDPRMRLILSWATQLWPDREEPTGHCRWETTRDLAQRCPGGAGQGGRVRLGGQAGGVSRAQKPLFQSCPQGSLNQGPLCFLLLQGAGQINRRSTKSHTAREVPRGDWLRLSYPTAPWTGPGVQR